MNTRPSTTVQKVLCSPMQCKDDRRPMFDKINVSSAPGQALKGAIGAGVCAVGTAEKRACREGSGFSSVG